jgi:hypothetical protein
VNDIAADTVGTFGGSGLSNSGEHLQLMAGTTLIDEVNCAGGWFAGTASPTYITMERKDPGSSGNLGSNWAANNGVIRNGSDANNASLNGTARAQNSVIIAPTATPTPTITPPATETPLPTVTPTVTSWGYPRKVSFQPSSSPELVGYKTDCGNVMFKKSGETLYGWVE